MGGLSKTSYFVVQFVVGFSEKCELRCVLSIYFAHFKHALRLTTGLESVYLMSFVSLLK